MTHRILTVCALFLVLGLTVPAQQADAPPRKVGDFTIVTEVPTREVQNQGQTGTCWSFATVSFLETEAQRLTGKEVDLSEIWPVRFAAVEKAKRYVMLHGNCTFGEGGLSHDVTEMVKYHGIVPAEAYTGLLEGKRVHNHSQMFRELKELITPIAKSRRPEPDWVAQVEKIVDTHLGTPPTEIVVDGRKMTPKEYATDVLKIVPKDYVEVMSFGYAPFYEKCELLIPDNWLHYSGYLNLPIDELMRSMNHAIEKGYSVAIDIDVSERGFRSRGGAARLSAEQEAGHPITQEERDAMFWDRRTTDDHLMHITGIVEDSTGKRYYLTKNSWGKRAGLQGYVVMSEQYVRAKTLGFMVHRDGMPRVAR